VKILLFAELSTSLHRLYLKRARRAEAAQLCLRKEQALESQIKKGIPGLKAASLARGLKKISAWP
jgi:hypothetical protein